MFNLNHLFVVLPINLMKWRQKLIVPLVQIPKSLSKNWWAKKRSPTIFQEHFLASEINYFWFDGFQLFFFSTGVLSMCLISLLLYFSLIFFIKYKIIIVFNLKILRLARVQKLSYTMKNFMITRIVGYSCSHLKSNRTTKRFKITMRDCSIDYRE
jgi:hypothetical protein